MEVRYATNGKANAGLATGIIGTALGAINSMGGNGLLGGLFGGNGGVVYDNAVNRFELCQEQRIAELETEVKLRDANIYTDSKMLDMYKYFDGEIKDIRNNLCAQAVFNQRTEDRLKLEAERRSCADNAIVSYVNATFYPKQVADVTVGTEMTAQLLYNPLRNCDCGPDYNR